MRRFYSRNYRKGTGWFLIQEYMLGSYFIFLGLFGVILLYLLANHFSVLIPGLLSGFGAIVLGQYFGMANARSHFVEIGFNETHFYLRSAYDVAFQQNLKLYPIAYSNATHENGLIFINFIDHTVRLRTSEWQEWQEIFFYLRNPGSNPSSSSTYPWPLYPEA